MRYEALEELSDLCQSASELLAKGRQEAKFIFFSVVFAGAFAVVQPLMAEWVGQAHPGLAQILWIAASGVGLVVLVVWCWYLWIRLAPLDDTRRKAERLNQLALKLKQIAYELQFERDNVEM